jgi:hypothetical protein
MKILSWNIKFFTANRIVGQTATKYSPEENARRTINDSARATATLGYIRSTVSNTDPDVFVVTEPRASAGTPGTLAAGGSGGPAGLIQLLAHLRAAHHDSWRLVPPQRINFTRTDPVDKGSQYTECIGVFWRSDRLTFTGPFVNTAAGARPSTVGTAIDYPAPWDAVVPNGLQAAGQCIFAYKGDVLGFPLITSRMPFRTTFTELGGDKRTIDLYSVHLDTYLGGDALIALRKVRFSNDYGVTVIAGDFNVDASAMTTYQQTALAQFTNNFDILFPGPERPVLGKMPTYAATSVMPGPQAEPGAYAKKTTYDFGMVHYGGLPELPSCAVIDRVAIRPVYAGQAMSDALEDFTRMEDPLPLDVFRDRNNYAKIGTPAQLLSSPAVLADGTSDHLPILLTV